MGVSRFVALVFSTDIAECKRRVRSRKDHPTLPPSRGDAVIDEISARMTKPTTAEGFTEIVTLTNDASVEQFLSRFARAPVPR